MDTLVVEASQAGHKPSEGRREYADEQLFARLIGAAVLLAVAVIVLPFLLDGSGSQREYEYAETLPVEPPRPVVEQSFSSRQPLNTAPLPSSVDVRVPETTSLAGMEIPASSSPVLASTASVESQVQVSPPVASQFETIGDAGLKLQSLQPGWNIQVASFVRDENAVKLINRLRAENLASYANRVQGKNRSVVRVLIGPFDNQIDALALQNRIDSDYRVESLMVRGK